MHNKLFIYSSSLVAVLSAFPSFSCTLTMGYRTNERPPLIAAAPDNSGLYQQLYTTAARKIGCELNIVRDPKKRILKQLEQGQIDFYPGFSFNPTRAKYTYFIDNGLPGGEIGISLANYPEVKKLTQLSGATVLQSLGSPDFVRDVENVLRYTEADMTIDRAVQLLMKKRGDFYIYNRASLDYYLKQNKPKGIKTHLSCCGGVKPTYLGFSKNSPYITEQENDSFDSSKPLSPTNFPTTISLGESKAQQLEQTLHEMQDSGETEAIYQQYYGLTHY